MIDIHCHILPDFDDGSSSLAESLFMAQMAVDSGVTTMISTPHFPGRPDSLRRLPTLFDKFHFLQKEIARENLDLQLIPGAEILCLPETVALARQKALPTIGDSNYILVEFYFNESSAYMTRQLHALSDLGYRPIVAHPERYMAVQLNPDLPRSWFDNGYVLQINKGSLLGSFGFQVQDTAEGILREGLAHVIASDAHGAGARTPHMAGLYHWLRTHCEPEYAEILVNRNPARIIANQEIVPV